MKRPKIIIDRHIPFMEGRPEKEADVEYLDQEDITPEKVKEADAIVVRTRTLCNQALLDGSKVKLVVTATIGTDHIDLPYCKGKGITVRNSPGCNAPGVAQYVWSSLLRQGFTPGRDKLGLVGYGNVGKIVADWARLLGCEVLVSDPPLADKAAEENSDWLPQNMENDNIRDASLETILRECDAITLHTPLTRDGLHPTYHLIGDKEIEKMKPGALLVNAARGPVVDSKALKKALAEKKIRAVIDTWEDEPDIDPSLMELTIYSTPHIAGYSRQGKERATRMAIEALNEYFGLNIDTSGLTGAYRSPEKLSRETIISSYDPATDTENLRANPSSFEKLRHNYNYREEA